MSTDGCFESLINNYPSGFNTDISKIKKTRNPEWTLNRKEIPK